MTVLQNQASFGPKLFEQLFWFLVYIVFQSSEKIDLVFSGRLMKKQTDYLGAWLQSTCIHPTVIPLALIHK